MSARGAPRAALLILAVSLLFEPAIAKCCGLRRLVSCCCGQGRKVAESKPATPVPMTPVTMTPVRKDSPEPTATGRIRTPRGSGIFYREWDAVGEERAVVFLQHGGIFHGGYFGNLVHELTGKGYRVLAMDLAGHGESENVGNIPRGGAEDFSRFSDDFAFFVRLGRSPGLLKNPADESLEESAPRAGTTVPVFVYGESMGAVVILDAIRTGKLDQKEIDGCILAGSVHKVSPKTLPPKPLLFALKAVGRVLPWSVRLPGSNVIEGYDAAFGDAEFAKRSKMDDKLVMEPPPLRTVISFMSTFEKVSRELSKVNAPLLVLHGTDDVRGEIENARELYSTASSVDKELVEFKEMRHQLLQDKPENSHRVIQRISAWIEERCSSH